MLLRDPVPRSRRPGRCRRWPHGGGGGPRRRGGWRQRRGWRRGRRRGRRCLVLLVLVLVMRRGVGRLEAGYHGHREPHGNHALEERSPFNLARAVVRSVVAHAADSTEPSFLPQAGGWCRATPANAPTAPSGARPSRSEER